MNTLRTAKLRLQIGQHAIGAIDRSIYHGAYPGGTAIRFKSFEMWGAWRTTRPLGFPKTLKVY